MPVLSSCHKGSTSIKMNTERKCLRQGSFFTPLLGCRAHVPKVHVAPTPTVRHAGAGEGSVSPQTRNVLQRTSANHRTRRWNINSSWGNQTDRREAVRLLVGLFRDTLPRPCIGPNRLPHDVSSLISFTVVFTSMFLSFQPHLYRSNNGCERHADDRKAA